MQELSILIGGKAGFGIDTSGLLIARILSQLGLRVYVYRDYPSLIRGGHTFSIIRASSEKIAAHRKSIDFLLALNQDTYEFHKEKLKSNGIVIFDSDSVKAQGYGVPLGRIIKEENASEIMRNTCIIGSFCKAAGIEWPDLEVSFKKNIPREVDLNLKVALRGYDSLEKLFPISRIQQKILPTLTGNEALGLGLIKGGLDAYISYPMTPSSPTLHFLAGLANEFNLKVIHPESEIGVILMALGFAYAGKKVAVGTSGGGFCLMTEGLSFSGMAELPVVFFVGQRPGPSTGLPTYSAQTELLFVLNAGQGEFPRFIVAPGDPEETYYWSTISLNFAWKYQIPSFILSDKALGEGAFSFDIDSAVNVKEEMPLLWDKKGQYKRYLEAETGVSPLAFASEKGAVVKINSYEHDESGITTEDSAQTNKAQEKRLHKEKTLAQDLGNYKGVATYGNEKSDTAILCWGSNKGVCVEAAKNLNLKVIHQQVIWPFPLKQLQEAQEGIEKVISVESNATGQLVSLWNRFGLKVGAKILRYDGRPFAVEELEEEIKKVL